MLIDSSLKSSQIKSDVTNVRVSGEAAAGLKVMLMLTEEEKDCCNAWFSYLLIFLMVEWRGR